MLTIPGFLKTTLKKTQEVQNYMVIADVGCVWSIG
jgi:hypothetical protein